MTASEAPKDPEALRLSILVYREADCAQITSQNEEIEGFGYDLIGVLFDKPAEANRYCREPRAALFQPTVTSP